MRCLLLIFILAPFALTARADPSLRMVRGHDGVELLVAEAGDPSLPGILFLHGFAQSYLSFHRQFESGLAKRFHLVAFDFRGHGGSDKPAGSEAYADNRIWADDVAAVIAATGLRKPVLVGWSFGGFVAMDYVRYYGTDGIGGIDMVGSLGGLDGGPAKRRVSETETGKIDVLPAETQMQADTRMSMSLNLAENIVSAEHRALGYATANMTDTERTTLFATELLLPAYVRRAMISKNMDNRDLQPRLSLPILLTRGSGDISMGESQTSEMRAKLPAATLSFYADTGHLTFIEREDRFDRELENFTNSVNHR